MIGWAKIIDNLLYAANRMTETETKKVHELDRKLMDGGKLTVSEEYYLTKLRKRCLC